MTFDAILGVVTGYDENTHTAEVTDAYGGRVYHDVGYMLQSCDIKNNVYNGTPPTIGAPCIMLLINSEPVILGYYMPPNLGDENTTFMQGYLNRSHKPVSKDSIQPGDSVIRTATGGEFGIRDGVATMKVSDLLYITLNLFNNVLQGRADRVEFVTPAGSFFIDLKQDQTTDTIFTFRTKSDQIADTNQPVELAIGKVADLIKLKINGSELLHIDGNKNVTLHTNDVNLTAHNITWTANSVDMTRCGEVILPFDGSGSGGGEEPPPAGDPPGGGTGTYMKKENYDTDNDGKVNAAVVADNALQLGGKNPADFMIKGQTMQGNVGIEGLITLIGAFGAGESRASVTSLDGPDGKIFDVRVDKAAKTYEIWNDAEECVFSLTPTAMLFNGNNVYHSGNLPAVPLATDAAPGLVQVGSGINVTAGVVSVPPVPLATTEAAGIVQIGSGITVANGVISVVSNAMLGMPNHIISGGSITQGTGLTINEEAIVACISEAKVSVAAATGTVVPAKSAFLRTLDKNGTRGMISAVYQTADANTRLRWLFNGAAASIANSGNAGTNAAVKTGTVATVDGYIGDAVQSAARNGYYRAASTTGVPAYSSAACRAIGFSYVATADTQCLYDDGVVTIKVIAGGDLQIGGVDTYYKLDEGGTYDVEVNCAGNTTTGTLIVNGYTVTTAAMIYNAATVRPCIGAKNGAIEYSPCKFFYAQVQNAQRASAAMSQIANKMLLPCHYRDAAGFVRDIRDDISLPSDAVVTQLVLTNSTAAYAGNGFYAFGRREGAVGGNRRLFLGWQPLNAGVDDDYWWFNPFMSRFVRAWFVWAADEYGNLETPCYDCLVTPTGVNYGVSHKGNRTPAWIGCRASASGGVADMNGDVTSGFIGCYAEITVEDSRNMF